MKETISIKSVIGMNRGFQLKILHSLLERFGTNFGMIELALIFVAIIALILVAGRAPSRGPYFRLRLPSLTTSTSMVYQRNGNHEIY